MFSLIQEIRGMVAHTKTPIVCVRGTPTVLGEKRRKGIEDAVRVIGGDAFIELEIHAEDIARLSAHLEKLLER